MISYLEGQTFNRIFVVQDRNYWLAVEQQCSKEQDLVLVIDFGLYEQLRKQQYNVEYLQRILNPEYVQGLNFQMHGFIDGWFRDEKGDDKLVYKEYAIGDAFLLSILTDITYCCHFFVYFIHLNCLRYNEIFVAVQADIIDIFRKTDITFTVVGEAPAESKPSYLFPIQKWMKEAVRPSSLQMKLKNFAATCFDYLFLFVDKIRPPRKKILIQEYHPTFGIIKKLKENYAFQIITSNYSGFRQVLGERRILYRNKRGVSDKAARTLEELRDGKLHSWHVRGKNIAPHLYEIIFGVLGKELPEAYSAMDSIEAYFKHNKPLLMVPICDIWLRNRLLMQHCKKNKIPLFFILNGLLTLSFYRDAKDSDWINCYGLSAKEQYFNNDKRALCLGDPRMDAYANAAKRQIDRDVPVIIVGTSAFNLIDLNSFLSVEFDFLNEIFTALTAIRQEGRQFCIELKVRANGYVGLYQEFAKEYFPDLDIKYYQHESFGAVIRNADLYISFYSQTLMEAASLGIPVIYYKNDRQIMLAPFDGNNELTTVRTPSGLLERLRAFYDSDPSLEAFCRREVLEQYVGPLDGGNTERNIQFIKQLAAGTDNHFNGN